MRFCVHCGNNLQATSGQAGPQPQAGQAALAPQPNPQPAVQAVAPTPVGSQPAAAPPQRASSPRDPQRTQAASGGPICWRCRGVGDAGSEFCKFCGARYSDGTPDPAPTTSSQRADRTVETPQAPAAPAAQAQPATHQVVSIRKDGTDGAVYPVAADQVDFGRTEGDVTLTDDPYLSPRHFRILQRGQSWFLRDLQSANGIYVRLLGPIDLADGDSILLGQQVLRFELLEDDELPLGPARAGGCLVFGTPEVPAFARLVQYTTEGVGRDVHYLYRDETVLGRETGDIVFTDDPFLSRRHAVVRFDRAQKRTVLEDLGSSNGTCARLRGEHALQAGDHFRVGRHLFRFDRVGRR